MGSHTANPASELAEQKAMNSESSSERRGTSISALGHTPSVTVTVRLDIPEQPDVHRELDIVVPPRSSLAEILDEVLGLLDAPAITVPWQGRTAAGVPVDPTRPLSTVPFLHGGVLVLSPYTHHAAPVVKDAAHALADAATTPSRAGMDVAPLIAAGLVLMASIGVLPIPGALVAACWAGLSVLSAAVIARGVRALTPAALAVYGLITQFSAMCAAFGAVSGSGISRLAEPNSNTGWALVAAAAGMAAGTALVGTFLHDRQLAVGATLSVLLGTVGGCMLGTHSWSASAAGTVGIAIVLVSIAPGTALRLAGLRVPLIPSAGQGLDVADQVIDAPEKKARTTAFYLGGFYGGVVLVVGPLLMVVATAGHPYALALIGCTVVGCALHAGRHHDVVSMWSLWVLSCTGLVALSWCALIAATADLDGGGSWHVWPLAVVGFVVVVAAMAPLIAPLLGRTDPTWQRRAERCEMLALAALIPLAAHMLGVFAAIRAWGF